MVLHSRLLLWLASITAGKEAVEDSATIEPYNYTIFENDEEDVESCYETHTRVPSYRSKKPNYQ